MLIVDAGPLYAYVDGTDQGEGTVIRTDSERRYSQGTAARGLADLVGGRAH
jgi:hypothetical protein